MNITAAKLRVGDVKTGYAPSVNKKKRINQTTITSTGYESETLRPATRQQKFKQTAF